MNLVFARNSLAATAVPLVIFGCNAGSSDDNSPAGTGAATAVIDPAVLGQECLPTPVQGATRHVSATWIVPVEVTVVDVVGLGTQSFEGKDYPAIDVRNSSNVFARFVRDEQRHAVYLVPQAPVLPVGAVTYGRPGTNERDYRYRMEYAATTLSDLLAKGVFPRVGAMADWDDAAREQVTLTTPVLAGLGLAQSRTYVMFKQSDEGTGTYQPTLAGAVTELTFTYQGRENVAASDGTYAQTCKVAVEAKRIEYDWRNGGKAEIQSVYRATVWLAPNVGPVRVGLTDAAENMPVLDLFLPAAR